MDSIDALLKKLISELIKSQQPGTFPEKVDGEIVLSGFISAGNGFSISLTRSMEDIIEKISNILKISDQKIHRSCTDKEWENKIRSYFGPPMASIDLEDDLEVNAKKIIDAVYISIKENNKLPDHEFVYGTNLFETTDIEKIEFGPLKIETREAWLENKMACGDISKISGRRIRKKWLGNKISKRSSILDAMYENDILEVIGNCRYVISVKTSGLAIEAAKQKSRTAAHLALTGIAMIWRSASSALKGFNLLIDGTTRHEVTLSFIKGKRTLAGRSLKGLPFGPKISVADWEKAQIDFSNIFNSIAHVIEYYLDPIGEVSQPKLMNTLSQAMLWFHEGCREQVDLMAIVKFSATLDALASGGQKYGILKLIKARIGHSENEIMNSINGKTTRQCVEEIYGNGRSRTIHGTNDKFGHDWISTRMLSESLARLCLLSSLNFAATANSDEPKLLLQ